MKNVEQTVLEMFNHLIGQHPQFAAPMEAMAAAAQGRSRDMRDYDLLMGLHSHLLQQSKSQLRQDIFVLHQLGYRRDGFFVEFGATNGVELNNTYLLEKHYGWKGILAEPARCWHDALQANRSAHIDTRCVWSHSDVTLTFREADAAEVSTIESFSHCDGHSTVRESGRSYPVTSISLVDLLEQHQAPGVIDYLSIDTEGSEYEILRHFDFAKYQFRVITCEHNFTAARENIFQLLTHKGYQRVYEKLSQFDDWYVLPHI